MSEKLVEKIRKIQFLSQVSEQKLLSRLKLLKVKQHDLLVTAGEICKNTYYIESGFVRSVMNSDGKEINLNFTTAGNFVTNLKSLRNGTPSEYDIRVCEPSVIWSFEKNTLLELYKESDEIVNFGRNLLEQLLVDQEEHAYLFKIKSPAERYQYVLKNNPVLFQKITLAQLASYIGISRETLSRIRKLK